MDYDLERKRQAEEEIRKVFREMFPLTFEQHVPWAACQIPAFLKTRIEMEVNEATHWFKCEIARVLCEVTPPKTHLVDMARNVVEKAKLYDKMKPQLEDLAEIKKERDSLQNSMRQIGKLVGCNHTEDKDGWEKLVTCVEETLFPDRKVEDLSVEEPR